MQEHATVFLVNGDRIKIPPKLASSLGISMSEVTPLNSPATLQITLRGENGWWAIFDAQVQAIDDVKSIYLGIDALNPYFGKVERQGETLAVSNPNPNVAHFRQV